MSKKKKAFYFDRELDFHGYTREEALTELEEVLFTSSSETLLVIHGKGSGILKHAVRAFVRQNPNIKSYQFGENINLPGGDGVTVIYT
ncbi:MAG: Smr/MutS family protein [Victivallaceae bacterium]|nr:Smr/MutS family protein [Victivallaceae bacterium]